MHRRLTPARRRGVELLDDPRVDPAVRARSLADVARSNLLFGGRRAVLRALRPVFGRDAAAQTMLDVGTGHADLAQAATRLAAQRGVRLGTIGCDLSFDLLRAARARLDHAVAGDALTLPFASRSVDVVLCSQLLHHFERDDAVRLLRELHRVARRRVIVSDLRRSWLAAGGFWLASFPLLFHPVTRHDGVVSVLRGFTDEELRDLVVTAVGIEPRVRRHLGFRLTASWWVGEGSS